MNIFKEFCYTDGAQLTVVQLTMVLLIIFRLYNGAQAILIQ